MHEELAKRLRDISNIKSNYIGLTMIQAADAIEELSKLADAIPHVCECCVGCELEKKNGGCDHAFVLSPKRAMQYLIKPRWIPMTERLPEKRKWVLCRCEANIIEVLRWENNEWYHDPMHVYYPSFTTHWMPLPEPPKEET